MTKSALKIIDSESVEIGMEQEERKKVADRLAVFLASTYVLNMKTLYYHWNVTGPHFQSLHALFEAQYEELQKSGDDMAERIRALGYFTPGTLSGFLKMSHISEDKQIPKNAYQMVENLLKDHETCSRQARQVIKVAEAIEDEVTVDMMVARMTAHDKAAWMLRSIIQE